MQPSSRLEYSGPIDCATHRIRYLLPRARSTSSTRGTHLTAFASRRTSLLALCEVRRDFSQEGKPHFLLRLEAPEPGILCPQRLLPEFLRGGMRTALVLRMEVLFFRPWVMVASLRWHHHLCRCSQKLGKITMDRRQRAEQARAGEDLMTSQKTKASQTCAISGVPHIQRFYCIGSKGRKWRSGRDSNPRPPA